MLSFETSRLFFSEQVHTSIEANEAAHFCC